MEKENKNIENASDEIEIEKPSYTYWKRESDKPFSKEFTPQKSQSLTDKEETNKTSTVGSAWNKAGTWEEKHYNKSQVEDFFNKYISSVNKIFNNSFVIEKVSNYSGDCYSVFVRGKKKFVHDCEITLHINGIGNFEDIIGTIKLSDVSNHSEDDDFEFDFSSKFTPEDDNNSASLLVKVKSNKEAVQSFVKQIFNEMKEKL